MISLAALTKLAWVLPDPMFVLLHFEWIYHLHNSQSLFPLLSPSPLWIRWCDRKILTFLFAPVILDSSDPLGNYAFFSQHVTSLSLPSSSSSWFHLSANSRHDCSFSIYGSLRLPVGFTILKSSVRLQPLRHLFQHIQLPCAFCQLHHYNFS